MQLQASLASGMQPVQASVPARPRALVSYSSKGRSSATDPLRSEGLVSRFRTRPDAKLCRIHSTGKQSTMSPVAERDMPSALEFIRSLGTDKVAHSGEATHRLDAKLNLAHFALDRLNVPPTFAAMHAGDRSV